MNTNTKRRKRTGLMIMAYGLILVSLIATIQLADRMSASMQEGGEPQVSAFSEWVESMAYQLPIWAYVVIFLALILAIRFGLTRYYRRQYDESLKHMTPRKAYTHVSRYQQLDGGFSRDRFAEMIGRLQETLQHCAKSGDFSPIKAYLEPALYETLPNKELGFDLDMIQLELCGFSQAKGRDIMSVLVTCTTRRGLGKCVYEWLFIRPSGETTPNCGEGADVLGYGGWQLETVKKVG